MPQTKKDYQLKKLISLEKKHQQNTLTLIPSENYASANVRQVTASVLTNKYAEGEPGKRYYQGNQIIDQIENLANQRALTAFQLNKKKWHVNCKALSASIANLAVVSALLEPGQKILAMDLTHGGHLSHGWQLPNGKPVSFSAKIFNVSYYGVEKKTQVFDYVKIDHLAKKIKPQLIISGGTAYTRHINYKKIAAIAKKINAYYLADIAHEAGLIVGQALPSPFPYADVVTMSTQKSLRGPRGSIVICKQKLSKQIDHAIFPALQGGPFNHIIAAIAACLQEATSPNFKKYAAQTIANAHTLADQLKKHGFKLVANGTDKHLILIDLTSLNLNGHDAALLLDQTGLITNKNTIPFETGTAMRPSGLRLGTPAVTTRGMKQKQMVQIALWLKQILIDKQKPKKIRPQVKKLAHQFPIV